MAIKIINGIPTAHHFKYTIGRTGIQATLKKRNAMIDAIYTTLNRAEAFRALLTLHAVTRLREVRRECYPILNGFDVCSKRELAKVEELKVALDQRINHIATHLYGAHKEQNLEDLNNRVEFEAFYDRTTLNGKTAGRALDNDYRYERATSQHFGHGKVDAWLGSGTQLTLNTWMATVRQWAADDGEIRFANDPPDGVLYLDEEGREAYKLHFAGGLARDSNDDLFHTGNLVSSNAGRGWGIFVVDFYGNFYVGSHQIDRFHHSSFFSGAPVMAGGEIAIHTGKVVGITNKTGHYKARPEELNATLTRLLLQHAVNLGQVAVNDPFNNPGKWFKAMDALKVDGKLTDLPDTQAITQPARVPE